MNVKHAFISSMTCAFLFFSTPLTSQGSLYSTSAKYLQISIDPRGVAMGDANVAVADNVYALYWNPAGLALLKREQISVMQNFWIQDIQQSHAAFGHVMQGGGLGLSVNYIDFGELTKTEIGELDRPVVLNETYRPYAMVLQGGVGIKVSSSFALGANLKYVSESIDTYSAATAALDLGMLYQHIDGFSFGVNLQNLGMPLAGFPLPMNMKMGCNYVFLADLFSPYDWVRLVADLNFPMTEKQPLYFNLGFEYQYAGSLALRAGYKVSQINALGGLAGITAGFGFHFDNFVVDYALMPFGEMGMSHRVALTYAFDFNRGPVRKVKRKIRRKKSSRSKVLLPEGMSKKTVKIKSKLRKGKGKHKYTKKKRSKKRDARSVKQAREKNFVESMTQRMRSEAKAAMKSNGSVNAKTRYPLPDDPEFAKHVTKSRHATLVKKTYRKRRAISVPTPQSKDAHTIIKSLQPVTVKVDSVVKYYRKENIEKAVFSVVLAENLNAKRWKLTIYNKFGKKVRVFTGDGEPSKITWNGKDGKGREVSWSIRCTYTFDVTLQDNTVESTKGVLIEKSTLVQEK